MSMRSIPRLAVVVASAWFASPARAADATFAVTVETPKAEHGKRQTARVVVRPGKGYHLNQDFPLSLSLTPPTGVAVDKGKLDKKDAKLSEAEASFDVAYTATSAGKYQIAGEMKFAVCSATTCDPKKEKVSFEIQVQ